MPGDGARRRTFRIDAFGRRLDGRYPVYRPFVALVGRFHVPHICFQGITAAANAHFRKVSDGVLCFGEA